MIVNLSTIDFGGAASGGGGTTGGTGGGDVTSKIKIPNGICLSGSTFTEFDFSEHDWSEVVDWEDMFYQCPNLTTLKNMDITVMTMDYMFVSCPKLKSVDVSGWDTSKLYRLGTGGDASAFPKDVEELIGIEEWNTSNLHYINKGFNNLSQITSLDLNKWDVSNVVEMKDTFLGCTNLRTLNVSEWDVSNVTTMSGLFYNSGIESIDVFNWDVSNVTDMSYLFGSCLNLERVDLSKWDISNVTNMRSMFNNSIKLIEVKMGGDPSKVTNLQDFMNPSYTTIGTFYYDERYDYSKIIAALPATWTAVPTTFD